MKITIGNYGIKPKKEMLAQFLTKKKKKYQKNDLLKKQKRKTFFWFGLVQAKTKLKY